MCKYLWLKLFLEILFSKTYYPVFFDVKEILEEMKVIPTSEDEYKKVFLEVPMIGLKDKKFKRPLGKIKNTRY